MTRADFARLLGTPSVFSPVTPVTSESAAGGVRIESGSPGKFMTAFAAAAAGDREVFLCDPAWAVAERAQAGELLAGRDDLRPSPDGLGRAGCFAELDTGSAPAGGCHPNRQSPTNSLQPTTNGYTPAAPPALRGWLMIPTGGTSGRIRFARHDQDTIAAAVGGFTRHFGVDRVNSAGVLPLHHVSGFMAWMRSALTGGGYRPVDWRALESGHAPAMPGLPDGWFLSLVPTQLERLLRQPALVDWLRGFRTIFLGGAPAWPGLLQRAADAHLPLSLSYGMTETAAMVTALPCQEFLGGVRTSGAPLPHARVEIRPEGTIRVAGDSVFRGYWPEFRAERRHDTEDLGRFDERGQLVVLGRRDDVIISGGEKIDPCEVEAVLRATGEFADVAVIGRPHPEWGSEVVAVFARQDSPDIARVRAVVERELAAFKRPKQYLGLADWPRTETGKLARARLAAAAAAAPR